MQPVKGEEEGKHGKSLSRITLFGLVLCLASSFAAVVSGFGSRWDSWHFRTGFRILSFAAFGGIVSSLICLGGIIAGVRKHLWKNSILSCAGLILGLTTFGIPLSWYLAAKQLPKIHDITTDTEN